MEIDTALILESLGAARKFADPEGPLPGRMMAASGVLPLPPDQIAVVLFCLAQDPEDSLRAKASTSLENLPDNLLEAALKAPMPGAVLDYFAHRFEPDATRLEAIALNAATADETYRFLASLPHPAIIDIVSRNQTRLLRSPELVEALSENPATGGATIDRVLEFLGISSDQTEAEPESESLEVPEPLADTESEGAEVFDPDDVKGLPEDLMTEDDEGGEHEEPDKEKMVSLYAQIQDMNVMEKVKLARFGNGDARAILVHDRNKVVCTAAIRSPKIKEPEIASYAKARNLSNEIMRIIANTREWTKSYQVKMSLATNPKTPLSSAMKFVNYLTDRDLRGIMRSRDVPGQISAQARRILAKRGKI